MHIMFGVLSIYAQQMQFTLRLDKDTYILGEPIQVAISYVNVGRTVISGLNWSQTALEVIDDKGRQVERTGISGNHWSPLRTELKPGEEDYRVLELNYYFGKPYGGLLMGGIQYFEPGTYTVRATHYSNGSSETAEASFRVVQPEGEEAHAYQRFIEILQLDRERKYSGVQRADAIRTLYETYPTSVYAPYFLTILDAVYDIDLGDGLKASMARKELVEKFPWSVEAQGMLEGILKKLPSDDDRKEYLRKIHAAIKGKLMEKLIQKELQKMANTGDQ